MLLRLEIEGMRLWRQARLDFPSDVPVVLIGPNGSGKSTVLEALDFLAVASSKGLREAVYTLRQGPTDFFRCDATELRLSVVLGAQGAVEVDGGPVSYTLVLRRKGAEVTVGREEIRVHKRGLDEPPLAVVERSGSRGRLLNISTKKWDDVEPIEDELLFASVRQAAHYPTLRHVQEALAGIRVHMGFSTLPRWARDPREGEYSPRASATIRPQRHLDRRGFDLINTLYTLSQHDERRWAYLVRQVQQEFPYVARLFFPADPGGARIALAWIDRRFGDTPLSAEQMSEGMWSYLSLLAAVIPGDPPDVIAFDEPDAHLHPSALRQLVSLLEQLAATTTVVITSHSTEVLDHLADPARSLRVARPTADGAELVELPTDRLAPWLEHYKTPSALREHGLLDASNEAGEPQ